MYVSTLSFEKQPTAQRLTGTFSRFTCLQGTNLDSESQDGSLEPKNSRMHRLTLTTVVN